MNEVEKVTISLGKEIRMNRVNSLTAKRGGDGYDGRSDVEVAAAVTIAGRRRKLDGGAEERGEGVRACAVCSTDDRPQVWNSMSIELPFRLYGPKFTPPTRSSRSKLLPQFSLVRGKLSLHTDYDPHFHLHRCTAKMSS